MGDDNANDEELSFIPVVPMNKAQEIVEDLLEEMPKPRSAVQKEEFMKKKLEDLSRERMMRHNFSKKVTETLKNFVDINKKKFDPFGMLNLTKKWKMPPIPKILTHKTNLPNLGFNIR